ncbi:TPA: AAA family ATPase [Aeromonas salmonicida]|nr:AAA family ATPase [Aeromonas salmonicida]HDO1086636.1 AAA family ATPase [Aeromonas salmonicida]HDO1113681.1 AAA family ATPase [Aeromonas salmonicida]
MIRIELPVLVERLNPICRHMLEEAAALCVNHQGAEIRIEHLLLKMLDTPLSDVRQILKRADVGVDELKTLLQPAGADSGYAQGYPSFSPLLVEWLQDSWLLASAELQHAQLRSGVMLLVLLMTPQRYLPGSVTRLLANVNRELLRQQFDEWVKESAETQVTVSTNGTSTQAALPADASLLARFTINVTEQARQGSLDPVLCRDHEIDLMIDILSRRRKNNPIVVGEAGVGKSALIEGLALRIVADQVPEKLREVELMTLDLGAMQAGASVKGEFEKRFKGVMQEVKEAVRPVILFIDEAHTLIGLGDNTERLAELQSAQQTSRDALREQEAKWQQQQGLVHQIVELRAALLADQQDEMLTREALDLADAPLDPQAAAEQLAGLERELAELQQGEVLVSAHVDKTQVAAVIAEWTGVPLNRISQGELDVVTRLPEYLGELIKGLDVAVAHLHKHLLTARADLRRPGRPLGAFLLVGPSGVGKTETVLQIAELMFGGRQYLTTINMSEYQEKHTVSRLIGSPPGYVGFGEGGVLTEAIRQKPYSVVLLDEVEKAHPDVLNLFYQAFDKGELADGEGRIIDCKNVVFFLTSNLGFQTIVDYAEQPDDLLNALYPELAAFFKPALLARMEVIPYLPLGHDTLVQIVGGKLNRLVKLLKERFGAEVVLEDEVAEEILRRANRSENGARMLESVIDGALLPPVSLQLLQRLSAGEPIKRVRFSVSERQFVAEVEG